MSNIIPKWLRDTLKTQQTVTTTIAPNIPPGIMGSVATTTSLFNWTPIQTSAFKHMKATKQGIYKEYKVDPRTPYQVPMMEACWPTGSRYICDPPPVDTDDDTIILVDELPLVEGMSSIGWEIDIAKSHDPEHYQHSPEYGVKWVSYRSGCKNLIYTNVRDYYIKFVAATELAKKMNLVNKSDRVKLFQSICSYTAPERSDPVPNRGFI